MSPRASRNVAAESVGRSPTRGNQKGEESRMRRRKQTVVLAVLAAARALAIGAVASLANPISGPALTDVPAANTKSAGYAPASKLSPELRQIVVAQGSTKLDGAMPQISYYGYDNDVVNAAGEPQMLPTPSVSNEAHKTEPDKNTYLVFPQGLSGPDSSYDYGTHFLFQGHEGGSPGYITRINLDADAAPRVTLLATTDSNAAPLRTIDGSTWDPFAQKLLFSSENSPNADRTGGGRIYQADLGVPAKVDDLAPWIGRGASRECRTTIAATSTSSRTSAERPAVGR